MRYLRRTFCIFWYVVIYQIVCTPRLKYTHVENECHQSFPVLKVSVQDNNPAAARCSISKVLCSCSAVDLENTSNVKCHFLYLLSSRIIIEQPRAHRNTPQCARYMSYGYTKNIAICDQGVSAVMKYATRGISTNSCAESHSANYKGCRIYKEIFVKRYARLRQ